MGIRLKRKIEKTLESFLDMDHTVLFIDGARQVGKTYLLCDFQLKHFNHNIYINLATDNDAYNAIRKATNARDLYSRLSLLSKEPLGDSCCIFLDEIQVLYDPDWKGKDEEDKRICDIMTFSKDLALNYKDRFIFSGSLLGFIVNKVSSWPVGYCLSETMYTLDFEEFAIANGIKESILNDVRKKFEDRLPVEDYIHDRLLSLFHKYVLIGGMPEAVATYVEKGDLSLVEIVHRQIEDKIKLDIAKYAPRQRRIAIEEIYNLIPEELNEKNKRFKIADLSEHYNGKDEVPNFAWVKTSGVAIPCYCVNEPVSPLLASKKHSLFKVFLEDTGILTYLYFDSFTKAKLLNGELKANFGAIYENVVACELHAHGFQELYYYNSKKNGEVDFLIERMGEVTPIEIKSGKDYRSHHALDNLVSIKEYDFKEAFVFGETNVVKEGIITYLPIYMSSFVKKRM